MNTQEDNAKQAAEYEMPVVIDYGWIEDLTLSSGVTGSDTLAGFSGPV